MHQTYENLDCKHFEVNPCCNPEEKVKRSTLYKKVAFHRLKTQCDYSAIGKIEPMLLG